jgi:PAS domain S-box-containing protein
VAARSLSADVVTRSPLRWALIVVATWLIYVVSGFAGAMLGASSTIASPTYPAAGVALACVTVYGWRVLPSVALGAFVVGTWVASRQGLVQHAMLLPLAVAIGATLQAWLGAFLVKRFLPTPLKLSAPREIAAFFVQGALLACVVNASVGTAALYAIRAVTGSELAFTWGTWWLGDCLGVFIAAPIVLTLIGQPHADWAPRRTTVAVPLLLVTVLLAAAINQVARWDAQRTQAVTEREANNALTALNFRLQQPLFALQALHGAYVAATSVSGAELKRVTQPWLTPNGAVYALGFNERVARADVAATETRAHAEGLTSFRVRNLNEQDVLQPFAGDEAYAVRYIEPMELQAHALGLNALAVPATREAILSAVLSGRPTVSDPHRVAAAAVGAVTGTTTGTTTGAATGAATAAGVAGGAANMSSVVIYQAVYQGDPTTAEARKAAVRGVVFAAVRIDDVFSSLMQQLPAGMSLCVADSAPNALVRRLAGPVGCEMRTDAWVFSKSISYAGRPWSLRVNQAMHVSGTAARDNDSWLFLVIGVLSTGVLGALLLTVTGRTRRIEAAVTERTAALQQEVHERQQAESALRESEQRFRNILNNVPIGVVYTDLRGNVLQTNPRFCELTGYSADELIGMPSLDFTHPDDIRQDAELSRQLVTGEIPLYRRNKRYIARDGHTLWVQSTVSLLRDEQGQPRRIVGAVEDITDHMKLAEAQQARAAAEASNHAKSDFLSRMSHELRTPLNAMLGFAQLLELDKRNPLADAQRPWVGQIQHAGWHLLEMINDVLDLSRIESGNVRLQVEPLELSALLARTVPLVEEAARKRGIRISQDLASNAMRVQGDNTRVKQILTNLLTNAVKYNADQGRIHVATRLHGSEVEISVTDTGLGMTPEQMAELFQPFNRLGRERSTQEGTGIGLVISQRLAELMGGSLRARSVTGEGSVFILSLPTLKDEDTVRTNLDELLTQPAQYQQRTVHYVEDNETNVEVMRGVLAQRPQVRMDVSVTGLDGLAAIRNHRPDMILLDMHLPDISGMELLRHLKADLATSTIPVVIVSADALDSQINTAIACGAMRYLTKPVNVNELLAVVDEVLGQADTRYG